MSEPDPEHQPLERAKNKPGKEAVEHSAVVLLERKKASATAGSTKSRMRPNVSISFLRTALWNAFASLDCSGPKDRSESLSP